MTKLNCHDVARASQLRTVFRSLALVCAPIAALSGIAACGDDSTPAANAESAPSGQEGPEASGPHPEAGVSSPTAEAGPIDGGGSDGGIEKENRSAGCGSSQTGTGAFATNTIQVGGTSRTYHLRVPANYSATRAYPLITRWHGSGGDGLSGGLDIQYAAGDNAIIVGADGVNKTWSSSTTNNKDLALFDAMIDEVGKKYCIDPTRIFSYGFSAGGGFTNLLGCVRGDIIRGTAAIASFKSFQDGECKGPVAGWFLHDSNDLVVLIANGKAARDRLITANGCSTTTTNVGDGCVQYQGCATADPVVWCETSGYGHNIRGDFAPAKVWSFFEALE
jgi:polyhydroxybutyrate depolymerase